MDIITLLPGLIIGVVLHEMGHAYAAYYFGDKTAYYQGRLNPLKLHTHVDPVGTIIFPVVGLMLGGFIFGWAKPVPIDPRNFREYRKGMFVVSIAGVAVNFVLALLSGLLLKMTSDPLIAKILVQSVQINCILGVFNLIPVPPLDGSKVIMTLFPSTERFFLESERYGMLILLALIFTGALKLFLVPAFILINIFLNL